MLLLEQYVQIVEWEFGKLVEIRKSGGNKCRKKNIRIIIVLVIFFFFFNQKTAYEI